jgi:homoserine O-acetyltransferase
MKLLKLILAAAVLSPLPAAAAGGDSVAQIGPFKFEDGGRIASLRVGYSAQGRLNSQRRNVIRHTYDDLIGPGKPFDTDQYLIVTVDPIGGGLSSKPADGLGARFPHYNIRDMVEAEARLLRNVLHIDHLYAVAGGSMGSFQALEFAVQYPTLLDRLILVAPAARSDAHLRSIVRGLEAILAGDTGETPDAPRLRAAAAVFMPWLRSDAYLVRRGDEANSIEASALADSWTQQWDSLSLLYRYRASASHDVGLPFGHDMATALGRVRASTVIVAISSDRTVPPYLTAELTKGISQAQEVRVESDAGHSGFLAAYGTAESTAVWQPVARFLTTGHVRTPLDGGAGAQSSRGSQPR